MENKDYILILEKSSSNLAAKKVGDDYTLEGIAAFFGKENENRRIYEEQEYLPHMDYLQDKISSKRLVGELDHPKEFDVSLKNISHIVEELKYNKDDRTVRIKVKLLDTPAGKIAKSLVDAGIPISISSRAAGSVHENKKVEIKKIFTYDLVADGGFGRAAELGRVYENLGFNSVHTGMESSVISTLPNINESMGLEKNSNVQIYRIKDVEKIEKLLKESSNKPKNMDQNFVTAEELNEYSLLLKKEMDTIKNQVAKIKTVSLNESSQGVIDSKMEARIAKLEKYADYLAENLETAIKYGDYLAENLEGSISYNKYLAENLDKTISYAKYLAEHVDNNISYSEYLGENLDKNISYSNYLAESLDKNISYSEYLAENLDKNISYSEYLAETLDNNVSYSEYIAENLDKNISYSEYIAENLDKNISYSEYIAENLDKNISYSEYIAENLDRTISYSDYLAEKLSTNIGFTEYVAESLNKKSQTPQSSLTEEVSESVNQGKRTSNFSGNYASLTEKVDQLIESVNKQKTDEIINENRYAFLKLVDDQTKKGFLSLNEAEKQKVVKALNEQNYNSGTDVVQIMGTALVEQANSGEKFLDMMPKDIVPIWESLNQVQKASIIAQSKFYKLETPYQINNFWSTRGLKTQKANVQKLDESQDQSKTATAYSSDYLANIAAQLEKKFKK